MEAVRRRKVLAAIVVASVISAVTLSSGALPASLPCLDAHVYLALKSMQQSGHQFAHCELRMRAANSASFSLCPCVFLSLVRRSIERCAAAWFCCA
jgi:hypothetical protein